jgi:hypothetical protein
MRSFCGLLSKKGYSNQITTNCVHSFAKKTQFGITSFNLIQFRGYAAKVKTTAKLNSGKKTPKEGVPEKDKKKGEEHIKPHKFVYFTQNAEGVRVPLPGDHVMERKITPSVFDKIKSDPDVPRITVERLHEIILKKEKYLLIDLRDFKTGEQDIPGSIAFPGKFKVQVQRG